MNRTRIIVAALLATTLAIGADAATTDRHAAHRPKAAKPDSALAASARISMNAARATALKRVPGGTIESAELEREHGKLIYSFDIKVKGKAGIEEVNVDATDGRVLAVSHEGPGAERSEMRQEKKEAKKPAPH